MPNATYIAAYNGYWGKASREAAAIDRMYKEAGGQRDKRNKVLLYRFTGAGHENAYVTETGMIRFPKGVECEELSQ